MDMVVLLSIHRLVGTYTLIQQFITLHLTPYDTVIEN